MNTQKKPDILMQISQTENFLYVDLKKNHDLLKTIKQLTSKKHQNLLMHYKIDSLN